eukprot:m.92695 g.92695  ORF g.92695 m.92695 type:complete len:155 (+) comp13779_c0_seq2:1715-2179(+)
MLRRGLHPSSQSHELSLVLAAHTQISSPPTPPACPRPSRALLASSPFETLVRTMIFEGLSTARGMSLVVLLLVRWLQSVPQWFFANALREYFFIVVSHTHPVPSFLFCPRPGYRAVSTQACAAPSSLSSRALPLSSMIHPQNLPSLLFLSTLTQ